MRWVSGDEESDSRTFVVTRSLSNVHNIVPLCMDIRVYTIISFVVASRLFLQVCSRTPSKSFLRGFTSLRICTALASKANLKVYDESLFAYLHKHE